MMILHCRLSLRVLVSLYALCDCRTYSIVEKQKTDFMDEVIVESFFIDAIEVLLFMWIWLWSTLNSLFMQPYILNTKTSQISYEILLGTV